ncbi:hypothetical protein ACFLV3_07475, partial [Chloroflexota bacterium]
MKPLFETNVTAKDAIYTNIRDGNNTSQIAARKLAESLWAKYHSYADHHFLVEIRKEFNARFWEMYLACTLMDNGYKIAHKDEGTDIRIDLGKKIIWVEAVTPTSGDPSSPDSVPSMRMNVAQEVPDKQITLKYCSVIKDKYLDKYFKYVTDGIIGKDDCYVIALNDSLIPWRYGDFEPPRIVRSVLPFGWQVVTIDINSHEVVRRSNQYRVSLSKEGGSEVHT